MSATEPIRSVSLLPLSLENQDVVANPFHPSFLANLAGMTILRFDTWLKTGPNANSPRSWSSRVLPSGNQASRGGVALEYQIALCNILGASPWFYLPAAANASDSYLSGFADLVLATLDPSLKVYIEYAHGVGYTQWSKANAIPVYNLWAAKFAAAGQSARLVHTHSSPYTSQIISHWGSDIHYLHAIAIPATVEGPFGEFNFPLQNPTLTVDDVLALQRRAVLDAEVTLLQQVQWITAAGLKTMAYGGTVGTRAAR